MSPDAQPPPGRDRAAAQSKAGKHDDEANGSRTAAPPATTSIDSADLELILEVNAGAVELIAARDATIAELRDELVRRRRQHYRELYRVRWRAEHWKASTATRVRYFAREHDAYAFANRRAHAGFEVVDICRCDASPWEQVAP